MEVIAVAKHSEMEVMEVIAVKAKSEMKKPPDTDRNGSKRAVTEIFRHQMGQNVDLQPKLCFP